jgi:hypothetical protein
MNSLILKRSLVGLEAGLRRGIQFATARMDAIPMRPRLLTRVDPTFARSKWLGYFETAFPSPRGRDPRTI